MKTHAIRPGTLDQTDRPLTCTAEQALRGSELPGRWARRERFVWLATGFGRGEQFLAAWQVWKADPLRCERLVFIAIEDRPLSRSELAQAGAPDLARQLHAAWPPLTHNLHRLSFEQGRVQLLLAFGEVAPWLAELVASVDAFVLAEAGGRDRYRLKSLAKLAAPGATLVMPGRNDALLTQAGFELRHNDGLTMARYQPRFIAQRPAARTPVAPGARQAVVLGAGLAGCAAAWALAEQGLEVRMFDQGAAIAQAGSGNAVGLFHGTLNPDDGLHARFNRAAALELRRILPALPLPWRIDGLLRTESTRDLAQMQALLADLGLPADYVQALDARQAGAHSGLPHQGPAWYYPGGGALSPPSLARAFVEAAPAGRVRFCSGQAIRQLRRAGDGWQLLDEDGRVLAETPLLVISTGTGSLNLLQTQGWPLRLQRGQITHLPTSTPGLRMPSIPVAGTGYVVTDQAGDVWCGATAQDHDLDPSLRETDHEHNIAQLMRLSNAEIEVVQLNLLQGRVGWRVIAEDRLPLVGALPDLAALEARRDQPRFIARQPGLLVATGMASRGITWAALSGQVLASLATGAPCPVEASLLDAIDPARFDARRARGQAA
ncbi:FAD-dependent 5-carboxymethylaminomethyl-2-thiouridine(34) oxidoreductase MnmC [Roseateles toxinivorans]|uniref:tRNA 5-methylaminomethyl-2-thiouridine biosynthesis bifunctional protein n=1 Tax=Roseateles toxinivorans TaxID=270368 RepID=A0A4R6QS76_9BURK|nr:FAD-dependent 5-carboxymethylaminomethyl-2-thiouridine(34) oxidoreductase MnmC [Roseateles toxinivorans]TDP74480.1 tRNA 5-methylaminomethyl-2-thiouridine biosynthesis bifunctional protein [Roseateles toxinivorans]